jgi:hypothetical protein
MFNKTIKDMKDKVQNIKTEDISKAAKDTSKVIIEEGVETVKTGIFSVVNGILIKIIMGVTLIVLITAGGCVGTNVAIDKMTSKTEKAK